MGPRRRMAIEHEGDQGPLETGSGPQKNREARPRHPGRPVEVENPQSRPDLPVGAGGKGKRRGIADSGNLHVVRFILSHGDASVGNIGKVKPSLFALEVELPAAQVGRLDGFVDSEDLRIELLGGITCALFLPDLGREGISSLPEALPLPVGVEPAGVEVEERGKIHIDSPGLEGPGGLFGSFQDPVSVEHLSPLTVGVRKGVLVHSRSGGPIRITSFYPLLLLMEREISQIFVFILFFIF